MMSDYIVGIGEVLWDVFPTGRKLGGAPANFAYHVSQFGLEGLNFLVGRKALTIIGETHAFGIALKDSYLMFKA